MWEAVEEEVELTAAWARVVATGTSESLTVHAKRNGRRAILTLWRVPADQEVALVSFGLWDDATSELTDREDSVCRLAAAGVSTGDIAKQLGINETTVNRARQRAMDKLGVNTREQLGTYFC